MTMTGDRAGDR